MFPEPIPLHWDYGRYFNSEVLETRKTKHETAVLSFSFNSYHILLMQVVFVHEGIKLKRD